LGALEHGQFPFVSSFVQADDVDVPVRRSDFEVTVVTSVPPIERFDDVDPTPVQMNSLDYRDPVIAWFQLNTNTHHFFVLSPLPCLGSRRAALLRAQRELLDAANWSG
jgi:hypothetical protein